MREKLSFLRNLALGAGVIIALAFGATEAMAADPCTPLPPHTCKYLADPDGFCVTLCAQYNYEDGRCFPQWDCCICTE